MIFKIEDFYNAIDKFAPFSDAEAWDNVGLLVGSLKTEIASALVALDLTSASLNEAKELGAGLIITHHPVIYPSVKRIGEESLLHRAIRENIAVISAHTNYDKAENGVNDALASLLELNNVRVLESGDLPRLGRIGELPNPMPSDEFAAFVKNKLNVDCVKYTQGALVTACAVGGGSCCELWHDALASGAQAFVTAEVKHHVLLEAKEAGFTLIDAGHFSTEVIAMSSLAKQISHILPDANIVLSKTQKNPSNYA